MTLFIVSYPWIINQSPDDFYVGRDDLIAIICASTQSTPRYNITTAQTYLSISNRTGDWITTGNISLGEHCLKDEEHNREKEVDRSHCLLEKGKLRCGDGLEFLWGSEINRERSTNSA